jgi:uncharacterized protein (DUF427 family)
MVRRPRPDPVGPGQESAWDYPRPPRVEPADARIRVVLGGVTIVDTRRAQRVLETSHPPVYYVPITDVVDATLEATDGTSFCEYKGHARYYTVRAGDAVAVDAAWGYPDPEPRFASLRDHVAFYADRVDAGFVDDEQITPQPGGFYGGWVTSRVAGPFKGTPGTWHW